MADQLNEKNVRIVCLAVVVVVLSIVLAAFLGAKAADQQDTARTALNNAALVECAKTPKSATDCRVLIFGAR